VSTTDDAIRQAIIDKFFEPTTLIVSQPVFDPNGGPPHMQSFPSQTEAPALRVARAVWEANSQAITDAVMARLDIDALVEQTAAHVTQSVVARLLAEPDNRWSANPQPSERQRMLTKVYDAVAEEFGRQCVAHLRQTGGLMGILDAADDPSSRTSP